MNIFLLGGWVALPSAFYFCGFPVFSLSYCVGLVALSFVVALPVLGRNVPPGCTLSPVPVPSRPSFSASLG